MKNLWNYFKGYVIIEISGFSIERFLSMAIKDNIIISSITETKSGVKCEISLHNFKKLKKFAKKTGCKFKINIKKGLPFFIHKNKKRKGFLIGIFLFISIIYYLSSFVWNIEIIGNDTLNDSQILAFCAENNLYLGAFKNRLNLKQLQKDLKNNFEEISWASIYLKGTNVIINLSENIEESSFETDASANSIIADEDGIITDIVTRKGTPLVKKGDVVSKGDILVSGEVFLKDGEEIKGSYLTNADADIRAKVEKEITVSVSFIQNVKQYTNKSKKQYSLIAFNKQFTLNNPNIKYTNYDKSISRKQLKIFNNFYLPFIFIKTEFKEYNNKTITLSLEDAKKYANKLIIDEIISSVPFSSDIIDKEVYYTQKEDALIATAKITLIQNIGEKAQITQVESERTNLNATN